MSNLLSFVPDAQEVQQVSRAADFFHGYPRIRLQSNGISLNEFSLSDTYLTNVKFLALPYLLTAVFLVLAAVFFNVFRYFRRGLSPGADDTKDSDPGNRDATAKAYLLFSAFLQVCVLLLIGVASVANASVHNAVYSAHLAIEKIRSTINVQLLTSASFLVHWSKIVNGIDLKLEQDMKIAFDVFAVSGNAFDIVEKGSKNSYTNLQALDNHLIYTSKDMYYGITAILLVFVAGGFLMYFTDVSPPRAHKTRIVMIVLFAVPLGLSWGLVAFSTVVGAAAGDFCYSLRHYHSVVAGQGAILASGSNVEVNEINQFIEYDLQCPTHTSYREEFKEMKTFFNRTRDIQFSIGMSKMDNNSITHEVWLKAMRWAIVKMETIENCEAHMLFGAELAMAMCSDSNKSAVSAMAMLWLASVGLSMLFGVIVLISSLGQPPSEYATGYEMLQLFGAPKLIRAFGDIGNTLTRQATFHRIATSIDHESTDAEHATLHVTKSVADAFTDCAIRVEDDYLVRISSKPMVARKSSAARPPSTKPPAGGQNGRNDDVDGSNNGSSKSSGLFRFKRSKQ